MLPNLITLFPEKQPVSGFHIAHLTPVCRLWLCLYPCISNVVCLLLISCENSVYIVFCWSLPAVYNPLCDYSRVYLYSYWWAWLSPVLWCEWGSHGPCSRSLVQEFIQVISRRSTWDVRGQRMCASLVLFEELGHTACISLVPLNTISYKLYLFILP